ncbi:MAG: diguanylate cyclase [Undibacterium sp.]|nr:diguanylate cyclase [Undibacterium sp.]
MTALAKILTASVSRSADLAARIGGEEFAILLPDTDMAGAMAVADRARNMLHELGIPHADSSVASCLTISVGIAIAGDETIDAFIIRADQALYQAKNAGRDRAFCDLGKPV